tara:strand:- start:336 stop:779 length:444 start_codon:yes stop_codon:yes gene_type:complete
VITVFCISIDQLSKFLVVKQKSEFLYGMEIFYGLNIVYVENEGISFGLFSNLNISFYLGILSFLISFYIIYLIFDSKRKIEFVCLSLILGGAIGNGIDRVWNGYVVDFFDVYYENIHWPAFNLADSFITIGGLIYIWTIFFNKSNQN